MTYLDLAPTAINVEELTGMESAGNRERIRRARVIFGLNSDDMKVHILFGSEVILEIKAKKQKLLKPDEIVSIEYSESDGEELELACAAIRILKGNLEFVPG